MHQEPAPAPWRIVPYVDAIHVLDAGGEMVCDVSDRKVTGTVTPLANARLIRSAPTLLHACRLALFAYDDPKSETIRQIKEAIAGAVGATVEDLDATLKKVRPWRP